MLHLAFEGLGAEEALSGAFEDNAASLATSRAVGYEENGEARGTRRDGSGRTIRFRLGRDAWASRRRDDIEIVGLEGCLDMFLARPPLPAPDPSSVTGATVTRPARPPASTRQALTTASKCSTTGNGS